MSLFFKDNWFFVILFLALITLLTVENINERFHLHDFEVYYTASKNFLSNTTVYGQAYGLDSGYYKYAPFALLLFAPFTLLPFSLAKIAYYLLTIGLLYLTLIRSYQLLQSVFPSSFSNKQKQIILTLTTLITAVHLFREFHLGNINLLLLCLFVHALYWWQQHKMLRTGLLIGLGILLKPHFIVLLPLFVIRKKVFLLGSSLLAIILGLLLPMIFTGVSGGIYLYKAWIDAVLSHQTAMHSYQTVYVLVNKLGFSYFINSGHVYFVAIILLTIACFTAYWVWQHLKKEKKEGRGEQFYFVLEFLCLVALVPNLTITDTEHFLWSLPIVLYLLMAIFHKKQQKELNSWFLFVCIISFVLYGGNWHDLLGKDLSIWVAQNGCLGIGNLLLLGLVVYLDRTLLKMV